MTKVLNIDDIIEQETALYAITVAGKRHEMKAPSVEDFIQNVKDLEALAAAPDIVAETETTVRMIARAFPTLTEDEIKKWPTKAIEQLFNIIRGFDSDGETVEDDGKGNEQAAS